MRRRLAATVVALAVGALSAPVAADTLEPAAWPPELRYLSSSHALRIGGVDRYATAHALTLSLRGMGDFPYDTPDRTVPGDWWGARTCPRAVIVVAGDTPVDALAAAPLSDPTDRSDEPRLERVAAADPVFDPVGGFDRVDTEAAPIIVTASGRAGAEALSPSARVAAADLAGGGCTTAREAIIVGGTAAVPRGVESELVSLGYREVFRVAGADRYETAARIATALGTEPAPADAVCEDPRTDDGDARMGFYGNAVIEFRPSPAECQVRGRAVILAEGGTGADALSAGWWASRWQVPILLTDPDGNLPPATRTALQTVPVDTIVVLGGTGRIPESTVEEAKALAGAVAGRFAGADRYATSVIQAQSFGGWHPTGDGGDFAGDLVCLAGSSGVGAGASGWPDALAAGPWCARAAGGTARGPARALPAADGTWGTSVDTAVEPAHDAIPVLLVPTGSATLPGSVGGLLRSAFDPDATWCGGALTSGCRAPGFVVAFGGSATVDAAALEEAASVVSGGKEPAVDDVPSLSGAFWTTLDLDPLFTSSPAVAGGSRLCAPAEGIQNIRWLAAYREPALRSFLAAQERASGATTGGCVGVDGDAATLVGVSVSGHRSGDSAWRFDPASTIGLSGPVVHSPAASVDGDPAALAPGAQAELVFADSGQGVVVHDRGVDRPVTQAEARLTLRRHGAGGGSFTAEVTLVTATATITAVAEGRAHLDGSTWELAGRSVSGFLAGGFRGTLADGRLVWQLDLATPVVMESSR